MTKVYCDIKSCKHQWDGEIAGIVFTKKKKKGRCLCPIIHLQGCAPDADNVVACLEWEGRPEQSKEQSK